MTDKRKRIYYDQKSQARVRGVEFTLTFDQWWQVWDESGKWDQRGKGTGKYVMARKGPDIGGYTPGNVFIQLNTENVRDGNLGRKQSAQTKAKRASALRGQKRSKAVRQALSASAKALPIKTCPHCGTSSNGNTIYRWHFDNCKENINAIS